MTSIDRELVRTSILPPHFYTVDVLRRVEGTLLRAGALKDGRWDGEGD